MVPPLRDHLWWHCLLSSSSLTSTRSPSSSPPRLLQASMNWVLPAQAALSANTFAIGAASHKFRGRQRWWDTLMPPNMVNNLVELLSQVHQIKVGSPHATHPSISIIFITATLGQHLHQHYPRLKPITPTPPSRSGFAVFRLPSLSLSFLAVQTESETALYLPLSLPHYLQGPFTFWHTEWP